MDNPRVSVVMPVWNALRFLEPAMDSILDQSFGAFELIVVDDGSTDGTSEALGEYRDPRVRVMRNDGRRGVVHSLTVGLEAARGEYVARMDGDDISHRDRFAAQVEFLDREKDIALVGTCANVIDEAGAVVGVMRVPTSSQEVHEVLLKRNVFVHPTVMFRRQPVLDLGGYQAVRAGAEMAQDYHLWLRLEECYPLANLADVLLDYRAHDDQVSTRNLVRQLECAELARRMAARRRRTQQVPRPGGAGLRLLERLRAEPGSLGADCLFFCDHYERAGNGRLVQRLAWRAVRASPLSRRAWRRAGRETKGRLRAARGLRVFREWLAGRS